EKDEQGHHGFASKRPARSPTHYRTVIVPLPSGLEWDRPEADRFAVALRRRLRWLRCSAQWTAYAESATSSATNDATCQRVLIRCQRATLSKRGLSWFSSSGTCRIFKTAGSARAVAANARTVVPMATDVQQRAAAELVQTNAPTTTPIVSKAPAT